MPGSWAPHEFPNLADHDYIVTSPKTRRCNCIAWAAGNATNKWWPDPFGIGKWPPNVPREATVAAFVLAFETLGYVACDDGLLEDGVEKVALYADLEPDGTLSPTHAAIQLPDGHWSSKIGDFEDITHYTIESLHSPVYGKVVRYLMRPRRG